MAGPWRRGATESIGPSPTGWPRNREADAGENRFPDRGRWFSVCRRILPCDWLGRRFDTQFGGAAFKRFLRRYPHDQPAKSAEADRRVGQGTSLVAGTPIPTWLETLHLLVAGATGTGKTVGIAQIIELSCGEAPAIIVDPNGAFLSRFYFPGDIGLNPFDKRSEA